MQTKQLESTLITAFTIPILLECMDEVKGTAAYSARLEKAAEEYQRVKIYPLHRPASAAVADQNQQGANLVMNCIKVGIAISEQPAKVQHRFNTEFENMLIRYGVRLDEMAETA